jgi:hypothetical protein
MESDEEIAPKIPTEPVSKLGRRKTPAERKKAPAKRKKAAKKK